MLLRHDVFLHGACDGAAGGKTLLLFLSPVHASSPRCLPAWRLRRGSRRENSPPFPFASSCFFATMSSCMALATGQPAGKLSSFSFRQFMLLRHDVFLHGACDGTAGGKTL